MGRIYRNCPAVSAALRDSVGFHTYRPFTKEEKEMADTYNPTTAKRDAVKNRLDFSMSCQMSEFERKMKPLVTSMMADYDIQQRFNADTLKLSNIESIVRQALWVGFLHGKGWQDE